MIVVSFILLALAILGTNTIIRMLLDSIVTKKGRIICIIVLFLVFMLMLLLQIFIPSLAFIISALLLILLVIGGIINVLVVAIFMVVCYCVLNFTDE
ncbi:MAG: hypothetical protein PHH22_00745 [Clostridia bacterium]|nr:hypothetical protein [Clostridia bacterium]